MLWYDLLFVRWSELQNSSALRAKRAVDSLYASVQSRTEQSRVEGRNARLTSRNEEKETERSEVQHNEPCLMYDSGMYFL